MRALMWGCTSRDSDGIHRMTALRLHALCCTISPAPVPGGEGLVCTLPVDHLDWIGAPPVHEAWVDGRLIDTWTERR